MRKIVTRYLIPIASLVYIVSPVDFIPDVIPVVGWLDDGAAFLTGLSSILIALKQSREKT